MPSIYQYNRSQFLLFAVSLALSLIGILFIYSSEASQGGDKYLRQLMALTLSVTLFFVMIRIPFGTYISFSPMLYGIGILLLLVVLFVGVRVNGAKSWLNLPFFRYQPSETCKLFLILLIARFAPLIEGERLDKLKFVLLSLLFTGLYVILISLQPDFGTVGIFLSVYLFILYFIEVRFYYIILAGLFILSMLFFRLIEYYFELTHSGLWYLNFHQHFPYLAFIFFAMVTSVYIGLAFLRQRYNKKVFHFLLFFTMIGFAFSNFSLLDKVFKNYHYQRFLVIFKPELDNEGRGYNLNQSFISIGSGYLFGRGLTQGSQNRGNFLPSENTDFILSLIAEEWGFFGISLLLLLYLFWFYLFFKIIRNIYDISFSIVLVGIVAIFLTHFILNIFSVIGFFPVVGIPLPFLSYGGSSLLSNFMALALVIGGQKSKEYYLN